MSEVKMWCAVRTDLLVDDKPWYEAVPGKFGAQCGHAFVHAKDDAADRADPDVLRGYARGSAAKIVVKVNSEAQLKRAFQEAREANIGSVLIVDEGRTVFSEPTATVVGFGPCTRDELPPFLKRLQTL